MPTIDVETKQAREVWRSPDGNRVIYELAVEKDGVTMPVKTYSSTISKVGWKGEVETYEKQGRNGLETFVKQPPKEGGFVGEIRGGGKKDEAAIQAMWAITKAIEWASVDKIRFEELEALARDFYGMVDKVKSGIGVDDVVNPDDLDAELKKDGYLD